MPLSYFLYYPFLKFASHHKAYYQPEFWISNFPSIEDNSRKTLLWRTSRSPLPYVYV